MSGTSMPTQRPGQGGDLADDHHGHHDPAEDPRLALAAEEQQRDEPHHDEVWKHALELLAENEEREVVQVGVADRVGDALEQEDAAEARRQ